MLVLSRKINESIIIGDNIEIVIVDIKENIVRLGITAPPEILVDRKEVRERVKIEGRIKKNILKSDKNINIIKNNKGFFNRYIK